ncbi:hypothetical protein ACFQ8C_13560 [Streptomyces sp. NPDC056503]|uniref:hypothetical protein n=1 Tax=Streptomyces sp. NPDC056503 TaxID=3345842 RepID=UPI003687B6B3
MGESVSVRCPECLRSHAYAAPVFPCACGTPVAAPVIPDATAEPIRHRTWLDAWVTVRCGACGREGEWPHPELGCACGAVLRIPVAPVSDQVGAGTAVPGPERPDPGEGYGSEAPDPLPYGPDGSAGPGPLPYGPDDSEAPGPLPYAGPGPASEGPDPFAVPDGGAPDAAGAAPASDWFGAPPRSFAERYPAHIPPPPTTPTPSPGRGAYRPVTIRTARDAVAAAATYLNWLGFREIVQPEDRHSPGVDLRGPGLVAQVDPSTRPAGLRAVECLWLNGLSASAVSIFFSLAGYTPEARSRAAEIGLPLFVLDLTGTPQPVNNAADELTSGGAI